MTASLPKMNKPPSHLFVVRHGNRLDAADQKWHLTSPTPYDPPLTYSGFLQARQVGNKIGSMLEQIKLDESSKTSAPKPKRRRFKVVIHSSPFLRCVQTSVGISSGLAQSSVDSVFSPSEVLVPETAPGVIVPNQPKAFKSALLRLDSFLGEWLSPEYFEMITPPPGPALMLGGAKADLLRREDYSAYTDSPPAEQAPSPVSSLWNASPTIRPQPSGRTPSNESNEDMSVSSLAAALPLHHVGEKQGYVPPRPMYAASSAGKIPEGFVAHARDACVAVDYQWDSMRPPFDFGDGGQFGEEWSAMHQRFRRGLRKLVNWYDTADGPTNTLNSYSPQEKQHDVEADEEVETVVIIVSHGAGCNALIGAITHQPVLMDVAIASITMAARKPDMEKRQVRAAKSGSAPLRIDQMYEIRLSANTEHLRSSNSTPVSVRSSSMANALNSVTRGRTSTVSGTGIASPFTYNEPFSPGSRSTSASAAVGNGGLMRRDSGTQRALRTSAMSTVFGSSSPPRSSGGSTPTGGLWAPSPSSLRLVDDGGGSVLPDEAVPGGSLADNTLIEDDTLAEYDAMLPNFDQSRFRASPRQDTADAVSAEPPAISLKTGLSSAPITDPTMSYGVKSPIFAAPFKIQTNLGPDKPAERVTIQQLGGGAGGLWGLPPPPPEVEHFHDLGHTKRRWTVNEPA